MSSQAAASPVRQRRRSKPTTWASSNPHSREKLLAPAGSPETGEIPDCTYHYAAQEPKVLCCVNEVILAKGVTNAPAKQLLPPLCLRYKGLKPRFELRSLLGTHETCPDTNVLTSR